MSAGDELIEYALTSPGPTRPGLAGLLAGVEREAREKAQAIQIAAVAKPGDTIMVGMDVVVTDQEYQLLLERYQPLLESGIRVFLVEHCTSMVVVRPELDVNGAPLKRPPETVMGAFKESVCPYTHSHTREFCGNPGCRES